MVESRESQLIWRIVTFLTMMIVMMTTMRMKMKDQKAQKMMMTSEHLANKFSDIDLVYFKHHIHSQIKIAHLQHFKKKSHLWD